MRLLSIINQGKNIIIRILGKTAFVKNTLVLMTGTGLAQVISFALTPVIARLYTPDDFGVLALFTGILSILSVLSTLRLEQAILLPKDHQEAESIARLSIKSSVIFSFCLLLLFIFFNPFFTNILSLQSQRYLVFLIPVVLLISNIYQVFNYYSNRLHLYRRMSTSTIIQSSTNSGSNLILGLFKTGSPGLLFSYSLSQLLAAFFISRNHLPLLVKSQKNINHNGILKKYRKFPLYDMPNALAYTFSTKSIVFIIVRFFGDSIVGLYSMTERLLMTPFSFFTLAFSQSYYEKIARISDNGKEYLGEDVNKTMNKLIFLLIVPFSLIIGLAKPLIDIFFGDKWSMLYPYLYVMAPVVFITLISSPQGHIFKVINKQNVGMILNIINMIIRIGTLILASLLVKNSLVVITTFAIVSCFVLIFNAWFINRQIHQKLSIYFNSCVLVILLYYGFLLFALF